MTTADTRSRALLERVEADSSHLADPLVTAAVAARQAVLEDKAGDTKTLVATLNAIMPSSTSVLERGLAIGMALGLQVESPK
jgi:hypothetical protein